ncbi:Os11g0575150 [Oryza sativa Japonica Group]|uniref:Os11g0575150 protein n=1 Tax=Oryza sativa subsp. japonica TaxID=39947 RepID=A0A0N7KT41_ORYSJ|nr:Os11g0575150 [Oryza sativa Japonica Group]
MEHGHERCDLVPEILHLRRRELGGRIALLLLRVRAGLVGGVACVPRLSDTPRRRVLHHTGVAWRGVALRSGVLDVRVLHAHARAPPPPPLKRSQCRMAGDRAAPSTTRQPWTRLAPRRACMLYVMRPSPSGTITNYAISHHIHRPPPSSATI